MTPQLKAFALGAACVLLAALSLLRLSNLPEGKDLGEFERVVMVGVPGLDWDRISAQTTPQTADLAERSAIGLLSTRSASSLSCPRDGWVTLGAGNRAAYSAPEGDCKSQAGPLDVDRARDRNDGLKFGAEPGLLGTAVECTTAFGIDAQLAVFEGELKIETGEPLDPEGWRSSWAACPLALIAGPEIPPGTSGPAADQLRAADALIGSVAEAVATEPGTLLVVAGLADAPGGEPRLQAVLAYAGEGDDVIGPGSVLRSASTARAPFTQVIDLAPTGLSALGEELPDQMSGRSLLVESSDESPAELVAEFRDLALAAALDRDGTGTTLIVIGLIVLLGLVGGAVLLARGVRHRALRIAGVFVGSLPVGLLAAGIVPWWQSDSPRLILIGSALAGAALLSLIALGGPWRRTRWGPLLAIAIAAFALLALDVTTGSHVQLNNPLGYNPIGAGRFAGFGNMGFAVFAACGVVAIAAALAGQPPLRGRLLAVLAGFTVVVVIGAPGLGTDLGGVLAFVPAVLIVGMIATGVRISVGRVLVALAIGGLIVAAIALLDYQRSTDEQTHIGRFAGQVIDGTGLEVVQRKAEAAIDSLGRHVAFLVPALIAAMVVLFRRPDAQGRILIAAAGPAGLAAVVGVTVVVTLGMLVNDSGVAIVVAGAGALVPALLGIALSPPPIGAPPSDREGAPAASGPSGGNTLAS